MKNITEVLKKQNKTAYTNMIDVLSSYHTVDADGDIVTPMDEQIDDIIFEYLGEHILPLIKGDVERCSLSQFTEVLENEKEFDKLYLDYKESVL